MNAIDRRVVRRARNSRLRANIEAVMRVIDELHVAAKLLVALRSQWWSSERIREYQDRALVGMMRHAVANVPFYQKLNLPVGTIQTAADLQRFPVIGKHDIQCEPDAFVAAGLDPAELYASRTSGSSGQPTTTYFDRRAWLLSKYSLKMRRTVATAGLPLLKRVLIISEQAPELLGASAMSAPSGLGVFFRQRRLSIHTPIEQHLAVFARYRPHIVYAYPSYLLDLIATAALHALALPRIETLLHQFRSAHADCARPYRESVRWAAARCIWQHGIQRSRLAMPRGALSYQLRKCVRRGASGGPSCPRHTFHSVQLRHAIAAL